MREKIYTSLFDRRTKICGHILKHVCRQTTFKRFERKEDRERKKVREKGRKRKGCIRHLHRKLQNVTKFHNLENLLL